MLSFERHNPNQWGYAGMTTAMKRSVYDDNDDDQNSYFTHATKITKSSHFIPPAFQKRESIQSEEPSQPPLPAHPISQQQQPGLLNDALISRLLNHSRPQSV
jgi:hypothetical protein